MAFNFVSRGIKIVGNADRKVSPFLKCWVAQGNTCVVGVIGEGTSKEIQVNWNSPFEDDTVGGQFEKIGGILQATTGLTSKTLLASTQIWEGNRPHQFNLVMRFYALTDAKKEVMDPCLELEKMLSPQVNAQSPVDGWDVTDRANYGSIPGPVSINIGRNALYTKCVIVGMTMPLDGPRTKDGYLITADVTLQVETARMLNRSEIAKTYG